MKNPSRPERRRGSRGFSLIITIALMVLLSLLAVGLLSLSTVTLRSSRAGAAMAEARANARLGLMLALGDLQKGLGADQRISARASLVHGDQGLRNVTGAWESWSWDPEGNGSPDYGEKKDGFIRWLTSAGDPGDAAEISFASSDADDSVALVNPVQGLSETAELRAERVPVSGEDDPTGSFAYAVMDESLKAPVNLPEVEPEGTAETVARRTAPARFKPEVLVPELDPDTLGDPRKLVSLPTAVLAAGRANQDAILGRQQAITSESLGLLTDVVRGGTKVDLSNIFEGDVDLASTSEIEDFSGRDEPTLYYTEGDGGLSWQYLDNHYEKYKELSRVSNGSGVMQHRRIRPERRARDAIKPMPTEEMLLPVIAKFQVVFSIVSHHAHIDNRPNFYNTQSPERSNAAYAVPHLVYDPVVSLYNPYDVAIEMEKLRIRVWDPPVLFGFRKNDIWLRPEFANGNYHGIARFRYATENDANARTSFTLLLRNSSNGRPTSGNFRLEPGEVKVFSPYVESNWTWGFETANSGTYSRRAFFDYESGDNFTNVDGRAEWTTLGGQYGKISVPGWDVRAGLQTDHLSYGGARPQASMYPFERNSGVGDAGWVNIRITDEFTVNARAGRTVTATSSPDFQVDLLAGEQTNPEQDLLRSYQFKFQDLEEEIAATLGGDEIERSFRVGDLLQLPNDQEAAGKTPFGILTMTAKTTIDQNDFSMPWLHNHPVISGAEQNSSDIGSALDSYDLRFEELTGFNTVPGVEIDGENRGYYGARASSLDGVTNVPMFRVPLIPATSLGDLIPANLNPSAKLPRVTHPFGNSRAHPLVPADAVSVNSPASGSQTSGGRLLDHSYLLNEALWDRYFFSTIANYGGGLTGSETRGGLLQTFFEGSRNLLNPRFVPLSTNEGSLEQQAEKLDALDDMEFARRIAGNLAIKGPFNVNSDSVEAWKAVLSSLRDEAVLGWEGEDLTAANKTAFPRMTFPLAGDADESSGQAIDIQGAVSWAGFRALSDGQIDELATEIVEQIRERGEEDESPSLSLAEFVNRRIAPASSLQALEGILQTAIRNTGINEDYHGLYSKEVGAQEAGSANALNGLQEPDARRGYTGEGAPPMLTQGDLLMAMAPIITVRGDTFRIRAYGESRASNGDVLARAWCEAVAQRMPEYLDPRDSADRIADDLQYEVNRVFGRRFVLSSFRWLSPDEV